jgi:hypothetical protein
MRCCCRPDGRKRDVDVGASDSRSGAGDATSRPSRPPSLIACVKNTMPALPRWAWGQSQRETTLGRASYVALRSPWIEHLVVCYTGNQSGLDQSGSPSSRDTTGYLGLEPGISGHATWGDRTLPTKDCIWCVHPDDFGRCSGHRQESGLKGKCLIFSPTLECSAFHRLR